MGKFSTTEEFIEKAKLVHGERYDYSRVIYINNKSKVQINCRIHGDFLQTAEHHLNGSNCPKCVKCYMDLDYFIEKANEKHNFKYNYSLVEYKHSKLKVKIICPIHGEFFQTPNSHLRSGCNKCGIELRRLKNLKSKEQFIIDAKNIHGDKYDYSLVEYKNNKTKVKIICSIHGVFHQKPDAHIGLKSICTKCANRDVTTEEFIEKAKSIHGNRYNYSLVDYKHSKSKVKIICEKHGIFLQIPNMVLNGHNCPKCENRYVTTEEFIEKARKIHGDKYNYSKVIYINSYDKLIMICEKHGEFFQSAADHLSGYGCRLCSESKGEIRIAKYLDDNKFEYTREKKFDGCRNILPLSYDFYLPHQNKLIEFDGKQHFEIVEHFGGEEGLKIRQINDEIKNKFAFDKNIDLIRIAYFDYDNIEKILDEQIKIKT